MRIAIDLGANVGQNLAYFIDTFDKVIAVEANPKLCEVIQNRFINEIQKKVLSVINCAVVKHDSHEHVMGITKLYVPRDSNESFLGSLVIPIDKSRYQVIEVPAKSIVDIIDCNTSNQDILSYCKVDLEGYDEIVIKDLLQNHLYPEVISFELHSKRPFKLILEANLYKGFKIIEGANVGRSLRRIEELNRGKTQKLFDGEFAKHSSGPCGEDIPGPWLSRHAVFIYLFFTGTGWKDIHASRILIRNPKYFSKLYFKLGVKKLLVRSKFILRSAKRLRMLLKHR